MPRWWRRIIIEWRCHRSSCRGGWILVRLGFICLSGDWWCFVAIVDAIMVKKGFATGRVTVVWTGEFMLPVISTTLRRQVGPYPRLWGWRFGQCCGTNRKVGQSATLVSVRSLSIGHFRALIRWWRCYCWLSARQPYRSLHPDCSWWVIFVSFIFLTPWLYRPNPK